jgi:hypothetical protein
MWHETRHRGGAAKVDRPIGGADPMLRFVSGSYWDSEPCLCERSRHHINSSQSTIIDTIYRVAAYPEARDLLSKLQLAGDPQI